MNSFTYENQGSETMLVYHLKAEEHLDSFAKGMLQSNEMEGILRPSFTQRDMDQYLKYPVTSRLPLKDFLSGELERETVLKLCLSVAGAVKELEEYMLSPEKLILDEDYVFVDVRRKKASLVYFPIDEFFQKITIKEFFRNLLSHMRFRLDQDVSYVAKLFHFLNQPKLWECEELKRYIENLLIEEEYNGISHSTQSSERSVGKADDGRHNGMEDRRKDLTAKENPVSQPPVMPSVPVPQPPVTPSGPMPQPSDMSLAQSQISQSDGSKKWKIGLFGKKDKKEPKQEKKNGLFGKKSRQDETAASGVSAIHGAPPIPDAVPVLDAPVAQTEKKRFFGHKKKKESKPFITPVPLRTSVEVSVLPAPPQGLPSVPGISPASAQEQGSQFVPPNVQFQSQAMTETLFSDSKQEQPLTEADSQSTMETFYVGCGNSTEKNPTVIMGGGENYRPTVIREGTVGDGDVGVRHIAKIKRRRTGQSMVINQAYFRIGSEGSFVDFYIADNPTVGGCHAEIVRIGDVWYIVDRNSANHTYLNGIMIPPMKQVPLNNGSVITLSDEDFDFIIS